MIHTFLKLYFNEFNNAFTNYLQSEKTADPAAFISLYSATLQNINQEALGSGIPEIFVIRYGELCHFQLDSIYASLEGIASSRFYSRPDDKITAMLDILLCHLVFITLDAERTLNDLNGKMEAVLKGSIFDK